MFQLIFSKKKLKKIHTFAKNDLKIKSQKRAKEPPSKIKIIPADMKTCAHRIEFCLIVYFLVYSLFNLYFKLFTQTSIYLAAKTFPFIQKEMHIKMYFCKITNHTKTAVRKLVSILLYFLCLRFAIAIETERKIKN